VSGRSASHRASGDRATGRRLRGGELGRCADVDSGLEMGWPEMGNEGEVELAAATVGGKEGIDSIRARAALGLGLAFC
jgi:hypothetical protein